MEIKKTERVVFLCAGPDSVHTTNRWDRAELRDFQLWVVWYGDPAHGPSEKTCDRYFQGTGTKWDFVREFLVDAISPEIKWVWIPDDDMAIDVLSVNAFFEACAFSKADIAQPSLGPRNVSCPELMHVPGGGRPYRNVDFIEIQMPCFSVERGILDRVFGVLHEHPEIRSGWGMDYVWSSWPDLRKIVCNDTVAIHTRPVHIGRGFYSAFGIDPNAEMRDIMRSYSLRIGP